MATTGMEDVQALERKLQAAKKKREDDVLRIQILIGKYFFGLNRGEPVIKNGNDPHVNKLLRDIFFSLNSARDRDRFKIYFPDNFFETQVDKSSQHLSLEKQEA